jgi:hypothetical protein
VDDLIALKVVLKNGEDRYFLTWGRIPDPVRTKPVEQLLWAVLSQFSLGGEPKSVHVCKSLQEATAGEYFYECFFWMCQEHIPRDETHDSWARDKLERMRAGKDFCYLGACDRSPDAPR